MLFLKVSKQIENIIRNVQFVIFNLQDLEIEFGFNQNRKVSFYTIASEYSCFLFLKRPLQVVKWFHDLELFVISGGSKSIRSI